MMIPMTVLFMAFGLLGSCAQNSGNIYPLDNAYLSFSSLEGSLAKFVSYGPIWSELKIIGFSGTEQLPIHAIRIGKKDAPRKVLVIGQHHGDEVLGIEVAFAIARQLQEPRSKDFKAILEQFQIWIIPTINPEGWQSTSQGTYQWKRKNNRDTNGNGKLDLREDGVDLNRNYPSFWAEDQLTSTSGPYYKGSAAASEPEIQAVLAFAKEHSFELAIFYHSSASGAFSEKLYLPWHDKKNKQMSARYHELEKQTQLYASQVKKDYRKGNYEVQSGLSSRMGNARNYFFHALNTNAFLIEIGGINESGIPVVHPDAKMMRLICEKHVAAFNTLLLSLADK